MEHVTFGLALCKSKTFVRQHCAKNARIPALGYGAVKGKEETQEAPQPSAGIRAFVAQFFLPIFFDLHNARPKVTCSIAESHDVTFS